MEPVKQPSGYAKPGFGCWEHFMLNEITSETYQPTCRGEYINGFAG